MTKIVKKKKIKPIGIIIILLLIVLIITGTIIYRNKLTEEAIKLQEKLKKESEEKLLKEIKNNYSEYVITINDSPIYKKIDNKKIKRLPSYLLGVFVVLIFLVALIISANNLMEYIAIKEQNDYLRSIVENKKVQVDELEYYIKAEIDDEYRERMARLLGYCYPDEIIYYID